MVATVAVFVETGPNATPVPTDTSALGPPNIRFKTADDAVIDANNPIPIPAGADNLISSLAKEFDFKKFSANTFRYYFTIGFFYCI